MGHRLPHLMDFRAIVEVGEWMAKLVRPKQSIRRSVISSTLGINNLFGSRVVEKSEEEIEATLHISLAEGLVFNKQNQETQSLALSCQIS